MIQFGCWPDVSLISDSHLTRPLPMCRGVVSARTRILAPSRSPSPTEQKQRGFVHSAARKSTGAGHPKNNPSNIVERW
ncbi:hypothetical protein I545_0523 [Mycobacterium kansasii 662]|uniref:Uncharacterized protein n=1 Tax=Mycobacterium kansasii 662 TaxID=1299326 RepID=X7ZQQ4_MYCKA|nr:hypothetical protein I545_0523 [Mycobacterium kansasii 662]